MCQHYFGWLYSRSTLVLFTWLGPQWLRSLPSIWNTPLKLSDLLFHSAWQVADETQAERPDLQACATAGFRYTSARWLQSLDFVSTEAFQGSVFLMWVNTFRALQPREANFSKYVLQLFREGTCSLTMQGTWWECWLQMVKICARTQLAQELFSAHSF